MNYPGKYADVPALSNIVFGLAWVRNTMVLAPHVTKEFTYCMYCAAPELTRICTSRKWLAKSLIELGLGHGQRLLFLIMIMIHDREKMVASSPLTLPPASRPAIPSAAASARDIGYWRYPYQGHGVGLAPFRHGRRGVPERPFGEDLIHHDRRQ